MADNTIIEKSPTSDITFPVSATRWLDSGDTLSVASLTVSGSLVISSFTYTTTIMTMKLAGGGSEGETHEIYIDFTTLNGIDERHYFTVNMTHNPRN